MNQFNNENYFSYGDILGTQLKVIIIFKEFFTEKMDLISSIIKEYHMNYIKTKLNPFN